MHAVDLHVHTTASDGTLRPCEIAKLAREKKLFGIAVTDHDSVDGVPEAISAGLEYSVRVIAGVELSATDEARDIHILGYGMDLSCEPFRMKLSSLRCERDERIKKMVELAQRRGMPILFDDVLRESSGGAVGRPHLARAMVKRQIVSSVHEAFTLHLRRGATCFVERPQLTVKEAVRWIHDAGGVAVLAHPALIGDDAAIEAYLRFDMDGIEVDHPDNDVKQRAAYREMARRLNLFTTAGSDFHGAASGHRGDLGSQVMNYEDLPAVLRI
ncbi:PHP domain-containing protein [Ferroacidibacillus organovorans]|nr:PHP domain-containing protein [Ferroacidibacillus organovorans]